MGALQRRERPAWQQQASRVRLAWRRVLRLWEVSWELLFPMEDSAWQELSWFPIEPSPKESISPRRELRAFPPSASTHLPAAVKRAIWFRRA